MKLRIIATLSLLAPLYLANPVKASSFAAPPQLNIQSNSNSTTLIAQSSWKEVYSSKGKFTINMPGTPQEETEKDGSVSSSYTLKSDSGYYRVGYFDLSELGKLTPDQVNQLLELAPSKFVESTGAKLSGIRNITLAGNPGKEFNFGINPQIVGKGRVYVSNNKLYLLVVVTPEPANVENFFNSFRLIA